MGYYIRVPYFRKPPFPTRRRVIKAQRQTIQEKTARLKQQAEHEKQENERLLALQRPPKYPPQTESASKRPRTCTSRTNPSEGSDIRILGGCSWILFSLSRVFAKSAKGTKAIFASVNEDAEAKVDAILTDLKKRITLSPDAENELMSDRWPRIEPASPIQTLRCVRRRRPCSAQP